VDETTPLNSGQLRATILTPTHASPILAMSSRRSGVSCIWFFPSMKWIEALLIKYCRTFCRSDLPWQWKAIRSRSIEVYDPEQNQWRLCVTMNNRWLGGGVVLVKCLNTKLAWGNKSRNLTWKLLLGLTHTHFILSWIIIEILYAFFLSRPTWNYWSALRSLAKEWYLFLFVCVFIFHFTISLKILNQDFSC
jgi:hypothetical protein